MSAEDEAYIIHRALAGELADTASPVRKFFDERFTAGLREAQRHYREAAPSLVVPSVPHSDANPGTIGTAADWLLRFLVHPHPDLDLAMVGCANCVSADILVSRATLDEVLRPLGMKPPDRPARSVMTFNGPCEGTKAEPATLYRVCWALALLSEAYRGGPEVAVLGPLGRFRGQGVSAGDLLSLAPDAGLDQLAKLRQVFEASLLPTLAVRRGTWAVGPTFAGSEFMNADADLIAAGLLLGVKTTAKKPSLGVADLFQLLGYALLDYDDAFGIDAVGLFSARYGYLATWELDDFLNQLSDHEVSLAVIRSQFRDLLVRHSARRR